jgi:hypothetical protein
MTESPFYAIFLIEAKTGLTLLSHQYAQYSYDEDLLSGMFKALESFVSHLSYAHQFDWIQDINFQGTRIVYERKAGVMAVGISQKMDSEREHSVLQQLLDEFILQYGSFLTNFKGNVAPFKQFRDKLMSLAAPNIQNIRQLGEFQKQLYPEYLNTPGFSPRPSSFIPGMKKENFEKDVIPYPKINPLPNRLGA